MWTCRISGFYGVECKEKGDKLADFQERDSMEGVIEMKDCLPWRQTLHLHQWLAGVKIPGQHRQFNVKAMMLHFLCQSNALLV
jgi:hypothetical protein